MQGIIGNKTITGADGIAAQISYNEQYEIAQNKSTVSIGLAFKTDWQNSGYIYYLNGTIKVNGTVIKQFNSVQGDTSVYLQKPNEWYTASTSPYASGNIAHNNDGSGNLVVEIDVRGVEPGGYRGFSVNDSINITLTKIPRASSVSASDAYIESTTTIIIDRKDPSFVHTLQYAFGSLSGYIKSDGSISETPEKLSAINMPFKIPASFYSQIPNAKRGIGSITCRTYSGNTQIGDATRAQFLAICLESRCAPQVSGTVKDINSAAVALTGSDQKLIRYKSTAEATIKASARSGSHLTNLSVNGVTTSNLKATFDEVATGSFVFSATDSRGFTTTKTVNLDLIPYIPLTNNASAYRTDPTSGNAVLQLRGNYFNGSFGKTANNLFARYAVNGSSPQTAQVSISGNSYSAQISLSGLDYKKSHTILVMVSDRIDGQSVTLTIKKGLPHWDIGEEDMHINVPLEVLGHAPLPIASISTPGSPTHTTVQGNWADLPDGPWAINIGGGSPPFMAAAFGYKIGDLGYYIFLSYISTTAKFVLIQGGKIVSARDI